METLKKALVSFGGLGYLPIAPGTWGTAGAVVVYAAFCLGGLSGVPLMAVTLGAGVGFLLLTGLLGKWAEKAYGKKDPGQIVTDEVSGFFFSVTLFTGADWWLAAAGAFVFFRFFDIVKLWPANVLENLPHGWGVALDDVAAGIYACICNHALLLLIARIV